MRTQFVIAGDGGLRYYLNYLNPAKEGLIRVEITNDTDIMDFAYADKGVNDFGNCKFYRNC